MEKNFLSGFDRNKLSKIFIQTGSIKAVSAFSKCSVERVDELKLLFNELFSKEESQDYLISVKKTRDVKLVKLPDSFKFNNEDWLVLRKKPKLARASR